MNKEVENVFRSSESFGALNVKKDDKSSVVLKLKILDKLLGYKIIDFKESVWGDLSVGLRNCFVSTNEEVFLKCLKIHHKIIGFYGTSCTGYLNLLKGNLLLLKSRQFEHNNTRRLIVLKLISANLEIVVRQLLHSSHSVIDQIITAFADVVTFKNVLHLLGVVDVESNWLKLLCYATYIRNNFFVDLKERRGEFIRNVAETFVQSLDFEDDSKCFGYFLLYFWSYNNNLNYLHDKLSHNHILEQIITKINHKKKPELKIVLVKLFSQNPTLVTPKLLDLLVQPLSNKNYNFKELENHIYIFTIIASLGKSPNYHILFGIPYNSRMAKIQFLKNVVNLPPKIADLVGVFLKSFFTENLNNENVIFVSGVLDCCHNLYANHFSFHNTTKFHAILVEFYKCWYKKMHQISHAVLPLMKLFYTNFNSLEFDSEICTDLLSFYRCDDLKSLITRAGYSNYGFNFLKIHKNQIIKSYLERVWSSEDIYEDSSVPALIFFFNILKTNNLTITALLSDEDEDKTVIEGDDKPTNLNELLERTLDDEGGEEEQYIGLLIMKTFIANLDLVLHLQVNYRMQEKLTILNRESEFIDAQSSVRKDITGCLENVGFMESSDEKLPAMFRLLTVNSTPNEFKDFLLQESKNNDASWLNHARRTFKSSMHLFEPKVLILLLEKIPKTCVYRKSELHWPPADSVYYQLHPEDFSGISLILNFGIKSNLLKPEEKESHEETLIALIKQSRLFIGHQPEHFLNFDWFLGIIFLICSGDFDQCKQMLIYFTETPVTALIWNTFGKEFDEHLRNNFYQHLDIVLEENCTSYEAAKSLEFLPDLFVQSWLAQCFFNILKFEEVCNFLAFSVLYPVECVLYYMAAIFDHLNKRICDLTHSFDLDQIYHMCQLSDFELHNHIDSIENLMRHHRNSHKL